MELWKRYLTLLITFFGQEENRLERHEYVKTHACIDSRLLNSVMSKEKAS